MKSWRGILFLIVSMVLTAVVWNATGRTQFVIPGTALTTLALTFMLATKGRLLEKWFHGIEVMYQYHKIMAVLSMMLLIMHNVGMGGSLWGSYLPAQMGNVSIYLFLSIVIVAFLGKKLKYETWRFIHRFVYVAYLLGLAHAYLLLNRLLLTTNLASLVTLFYAVLGVISGFYIIFIYPNTAFRYEGRVAAIRKLNHDTSEVEIALRRPFSYQHGQFSFLKIYHDGFETAAHPFTISGGHGKTVFFSIKSSGDFTGQIYKELQVGSKVALDRAYGHMILDEGRSKQTWIAGGIGITPFIAYLREHETLDKQVDFFYAYTGAENAVYLDFLRDYAQKNPNFNLTTVDSKVDGFLNFDHYDLADDSTVFMCGPVKMMQAFSKVLHEKNPKTEIVYEGFSFR